MLLCLRSNGSVCLGIKSFVYKIILISNLGGRTLRSNVQHRHPVWSCRSFLQMDSLISMMNLRLPSAPSAAALCYLALMAVVAYFICLCIYNCFFHPLAGFPGPWLCAMSEWFLVVFIQTVPTYGLELHKRYGRHGFNHLDLTVWPNVYDRPDCSPGTKRALLQRRHALAAHIS